jgi:phytanoyl-CoA hydroxylase
MPLLNQDQKNQYQENGFLILDDFFTKAELDDFSDAVRKTVRVFFDKAVAEKGVSIIYPPETELDEGICRLEEIDHSYVAAIYDTICHLSSFFRIVGKKEMASTVNQLLNRPTNAPIYEYLTRCRIDLPDDGARLYEWHQEVFHSIPKANFVQAWAPLVRDILVENGALKVCPGSHKSGALPQALDKQTLERTGGSLGHYYIVSPEIVKLYEELNVEMKLGQLLLFDPKLVHRSGENTSRLVRYSMVGMFNDIDGPSFYPPHPEYKYKGLTPAKYYAEVSKELGWDTT